jgi:excisionase family DNA binding protein
MDEQKDRSAQVRDTDHQGQDDIDEGLHVGFISATDFEDRARIEMHRREHPHDRAHVDLRQEEYTPEEVARLIGTSREVVMHAVWNGELKADRKGRNVVCITHADVVDWLRRRGPGV